MHDHSDSPSSEPSFHGVPWKSSSPVTGKTGTTGIEDRDGHVPSHDEASGRCDVRMDEKPGSSAALERSSKGPSSASHSGRTRAAAAKTALREARKQQLTKVLRLEIATAVWRTTRTAPSMRRRDEKPTGTPLAPFGSSTEGWLPTVRRRDATGKWNDSLPGSPARALFEVLWRLQRRVRSTGNAALLAMLKESDKTKVVDAKKQLASNERYPFETIAYRAVVKAYPDSKELPVVSSGGLCATLSQKVAKEFTDWIKSKQRDRFPMLSDGWPVWTRKDSWRITRDDGLNIAFNLDGTWWEIGLKIPRKNTRQSADPFVLRVLERLVKGEPQRGSSGVPTATTWMAGEIGFQYRNSKWYALIQYRQPKPKPFEGQNHMVVHCGLRTFACAATLDEIRTGRVGIREDLLDLNNRKARFRAQRKDIARAQRRRGLGHGYASVWGRNKATLTATDYVAKRAYVDDAETRFTENVLRRLAARVARRALARGAVVHFMNLENIRTRTQHSDLPGRIKVRVHQAPWFKFKEFLQQKLAAHGATVEPYEARYHTQRCPACLHVSAAAPNYKRWKFACTRCGYSNDLETVAVANAFVDLGILKPKEATVAGEGVSPQRELAMLHGLDLPPRERPGDARRSTSDRRGKSAGRSKKNGGARK